MNLDFCPNIKSKEFKEMSSIFGEDKAYFLWMRNNGNHLEKAPNGADSKLFNDLLNHFNGDRKEALRAKAKVYRNEFLNWFGDWMHFDKTNPYSSKIFVTNVAPDYDSADAEGPGAMFAIFEGDKYIGSIAINANYKGKNQFKTWGEKGTNYVSMSSVGDAVEIEEEFRGKGYGKAAYFEFAKQMANMGYVLRSAPAKSRTEASTRVWKSLVRDGYAKEAGDRYEIINSSLINASKVVDENGEPLMVYHGSVRTTEEASSIVNLEYFTTPDIEQAASYTGYGSYKDSNRNDYIRSVFMNLRNPLIIDNLGAPFYETKYKGKTINSDALVELAKKEGYDGFMLYNTKDFGDNIEAIDETKEINPSTFAAFNTPNQIKSATDNNGMFSTENDVIYNNLSATPDVIPQFPTEGKLGELREKEFALQQQWKELQRQFNELLAKINELIGPDELSKRTVSVNGEDIIFSERKNRTMYIGNGKNIFGLVSTWLGLMNNNTIKFSLLFPNSRIFDKECNYNRINNSIKNNTVRLIYELLSVLKDNGQTVVYSPWEVWTNGMFTGMPENPSILIDRMSKLLLIDCSKFVTSEEKTVLANGPLGEYKLVNFRVVFNIDSMLKLIPIIGHNLEIYDAFNNLYNRPQEKINNSLVVRGLQTKQKDLKQKLEDLSSLIKDVLDDIKQEERRIHDDRIRQMSEDVRQKFGEFLYEDLPFNITQQSLIYAVQNVIDLGMRYDDIRNLINAVNYHYGSSLKYNGKTKTVYGKKLSKAKDDISKTTDKNVQKIEDIVNYLNNKFGGKIHVLLIEEDEWIKNEKLFNGSNSCIINDTVYLRKSRMTTEIAAEEMLHVLVHAMKNGSAELGNPELFNNLFSKAKKSFPKLWDEIQAVYKYNKDEELVTQVLARYLTKDFDKRDTYKIQELVDKFKNWVLKLFKDVLEQFGGNKYITLGSINPLLDFQDISDIILAKDLYFDILTISELHTSNINDKLNAKEYHNLNSYESAQQAYDIAESIDSEKASYISQVVSQYQNNNKQATDDDIARVKNAARIAFNKRKLQEVRPDGNIPATVKDIIIAALSEEDLRQSEGVQRILDRAEGKINSRTTEADKNILSQIKQGTKTRLRSHLSRNIKRTNLIDKLKQQLEILDTKNEDSVEDIFETIEDFLQHAEVEIIKTALFIKSEMGDDISKWDPAQINAIKQDFIGYYEGLLKSIKNLFNSNSAVKLLNDVNKQDPNAMDLEHMVSELYKDLKDLQEDYQSTVVMPYAEKVLVDFVNDSDVVVDKESFIRNMKRWLHQDTAYGDLTAGEVAIGMASRSRSSIVKIVEKMISDVEFEKGRRVLKKGKELINLYNNIRPVGSQISWSNFLKTFIELDGEDGSTGMPTGYWLRDRNYGKFYKDKDAFEEKLREKYANKEHPEKGLRWKYNEYNDSVELIFPEENHLANDSVYNKYYDELDEWLDKHCERRYKLEYYKKRRRYLSPAAMQAQLFIQHQIDILCQKAIDEDGWVDSNLLDPQERSKLKQLRKAKRELACPYIFSTATDGIVTLELKVGEAAQIAEQISNWNEYIQNHVLYKENKEKFEKALSKYPEGSVERRRFLADNQIVRINPDIYDAMEMWWNGIFSGYGDEYNKLKRRYKAIIKHVTYKEGYVQPDLDQFGAGLDGQDTSVWKELKELDQRMSQIKEEYEAEHGKMLPSLEDEDGEVPLFLTSKLVMSSKEAKPFYEYIQLLYAQHPGNPVQLSEQFGRLFTYTDGKGQIRVLKAFSYMGPIADTFKYDPKDPTEEEKPSLIKTYSSQFSELDEASDFVNEKWRKDLKASLQPKVRKPGTSRKTGTIDYTNDLYNKVMSNEGYKKFYELLISTMDEANSMIPARAIERRYLLPQITARGMQALGRSRSVLDLQTAVGYMFQDVFTAKFAEKDADVSTNWDLPRRPDGTVVNNIPIRFVKRLENPALISTDIVGSVMLYYDMAVNYSLKSENLPSLELIKEAINPESSTGGKQLPKQFLKVENLLNFRYYGKEDVIGKGEQAPSELNKRITTIGKKFRSLASMSMLAINFTTIEVGYIDAFLSAIADSVGGKYFTKSDLAHGYTLALRHLPNIILNIGSPATDDWMIAAMQYNQLSRSNSEIFSRTDQSRFRKALNQVRMGGYTMADYLINIMILGATYNHYKLVDLPDGTGLKFMSQSDTINEYVKLGYTEEEAIDKWSSSTTTLEQAYTVIDGLFTVKDDYKQYVTKKLENQIAGRLRDRTAVYNGVIPQTEKAKIQQNVWGSYLTLMRNFYVNTFWERAQAGYDTAAEEDLKSSKLGMRSADSAGYVNFETGEFGNGLWWSFLKGMYKYVSNVKRLVTGKDMKQLTRDQRYAVKRILSEIIMIAISAKLMLLSIAFARSNDYDDDKDPTWTVNFFDPEGEDRSIFEFNGNNYDKKFTNWLRWKLALLSTRTFTERSTFYWPGTVTELISSPSTAKSYLDDLGYSLELFMDLFEINGHDRNEMVKSGGYSGMTRGTRDVLKIGGATGIDNLIRGWHTSGIKSTLNWYQGVSPNNFLIPSKKTWDAEHGNSNESNKPIY